MQIRGSVESEVTVIKPTNMQQYHTKDGSDVSAVHSHRGERQEAVKRGQVTNSVSGDVFISVVILSNSLTAFRHTSAQRRTGN
jgi:hypothetical protein